MMVKKLAEVLETDPDEYFNGTYDWYFTGGSMDTVEVDGQEFLLHSEGNALQNLSKYDDSSFVGRFVYKLFYRNLYI